MLCPFPSFPCGSSADGYLQSIPYRSWTQTLQQLIPRCGAGRRWVTQPQGHQLLSPVQQTSPALQRLISTMSTASTGGASCRLFPHHHEKMGHVTVKSREGEEDDWWKRTKFSLCLFEQYFSVLCSSMSINSTVLHWMDTWTSHYFPLCIVLSLAQPHIHLDVKVTSAHTSCNP